MADSGSLRKAVLDGVTFDVMADCNITFNRGKFEREGTPTTGRTRQKATLRVRTIEGLEVATNPSEMETLKTISEKSTSVTMAITLADSSIYRATGAVYFENYESETGKSAITLIPDRDWTPFTAS